MSHLREGARRSVRVVKFADDNERVYKTLPLHPAQVPGTAPDLNWGFRNASLGLGMDALPTKEGEMVAVLLAPKGRHDGVWVAVPLENIEVQP